MECITTKYTPISTVDNRNSNFTVLTSRIRCSNLSNSKVHAATYNNIFTIGFNARSGIKLKLKKRRKSIFCCMRFIWNLANGKNCEVSNLVFCSYLYVKKAVLAFKYGTLCKRNGEKREIDSILMV